MSRPPFLSGTEALHRWHPNFLGALSKVQPPLVLAGADLRCHVMVGLNLRHRVCPDHLPQFTLT